MIGISIIILSYLALKIYRYVKTLRATETHKSSIIFKKKQNNDKKKIKKKYDVLLKADIVKKTWVAVKIDRKHTKTAMLYPKEVMIWKAYKRLKIKIGNAGGIILNYNGKNIGKPGKEGQVVTLFFPPKKTFQ